jgi:hypothetical protein
MKNPKRNPDLIVIIFGVISFLLIIFSLVYLTSAKRRNGMHRDRWKEMERFWDKWDDENFRDRWKDLEDDETLFLEKERGVLWGACYQKRLLSPVDPEDTVQASLRP